MWGGRRKEKRPRNACEERRTRLRSEIEVLVGVGISHVEKNEKNEKNEIVVRMNVEMDE